MILGNIGHIRIPERSNWRNTGSPPDYQQQLPLSSYLPYSNSENNCFRGEWAGGGGGGILYQLSSPQISKCTLNFFFPSWFPHRIP
ncbi:hypothetical protein PDIP_61950 [Penicillium digitatum Pd1]|uniref:Uncharacterized protein n=1 Tax=Penicillium digitatum (strain Pd1 / CECT 20795) TaxID=1170230 RepID=K9FNU4_PEND1|nr:hypothetical protein PDIP_61950 [Penicillium digitatum Pd1]EKV10057.1 hypothetical protein PDIP_61950 [Penicillium digitatum Pd1]